MVISESGLSGHLWTGASLTLRHQRVEVRQIPRHAITAISPTLQHRLLTRLLLTWHGFHRWRLLPAALLPSRAWRNSTPLRRVPATIRARALTHVRSRGHLHSEDG